MAAPAPATASNSLAVVYVDPEYLARKKEAANKLKNATDAVYDKVATAAQPAIHGAIDKSLGASEATLAQNLKDRAPASLQSCVGPSANSAAGCIKDKVAPHVHAGVDNVIEKKIPGAMHASIDKTCDAAGPSLQNKGCI